MTSNAGCWKRRLAALAIATSLLSGCATVGSDTGIATICPPVVEYTSEVQTRAAEELALLPKGTAIAEMLADYAVMREQARACSETCPSIIVASGLPLQEPEVPDPRR
jgi:uncharacterized protein YceK